MKMIKRNVFALAFAAMVIGLMLFMPSIAVASGSGDTVRSDNGVWTHLEDIDPITDEDSSATATEGDQRRSALMIRCNSGGVEVFVTFGTYVGSTSESYSTVIYRFDEDDPVEARWSQSTDGRALFVLRDDREDFISEVVNSERLVVRTEDHRGTPETVQFETAGDDGLIERLSCVDLDDEDDSGESSSDN